jgi:glucose/mannose-6-phosphate isomerase
MRTPSKLSEFNHNEFLGWKNPRDKLLKVVQLHSSLDGERIARRWEISNRLLSGQMPRPIIVEAVGETQLQQMLWTQLLGDYVSVYLAFLNGQDPTPVDLIEKLKKELKGSSQ